MPLLHRFHPPLAGLRLLLALGACLLALLRPAAGQDTGGIQGTLLDGWDGKPLAGVTVLLRGTTLATTSDALGRYLLQGVVPGEHAVRFSRSGYAAVAVTGIRVIAGQVTTANGTLRPEFYELEEYEVTAEEFESGTVALLLERQSAAGLMDAIGSEQFRRLGVSDAADIMTKVAG
ncbi:MAG TPA: carboxypeptidase-like regulatory domain-containing protein, partial [Verrucomicrobiota bacterium]|nr:carboxypeptidase-like regulatory domain-containing protein [Verrucomicrobiota bacterium]